MNTEDLKKLLAEATPGPWVLADRLEAHTEQMANTSWGLTMQEWNVISNDILLAARTLRAALAPAADDEVGAIRGRHEDMQEVYGDEAICPMGQRDRATLLRHVDRLTAELEAERGRRVEVEGALRESIPQNIMDVAVRIGFGEWGSTAAKSAEDHAADTASSVKLTAEHFQQESDQAMHGVYIAGTETVICHTGTSPNSPQIARALTGVWNKLVELSMQRSATHKDTQDE